MPTATVWVALTKIYYNGGLAYNAGDIIPDANNTLYGYGTAGLATQATVQLPSGITTTGVDMATQAELDALVYRGSTAPSVTTGIWVDTTATPEVVKYHNGTAWVPLGSAAYLAKPANVATDLVPGSVIAHRGSYLLYPEDTLESLKYAVATGARIVKFDVVKLLDGAFGVMHDASVDRTTTGTGNANTFTTAAWKNLVIDSAAQGYTGFPNLTPPLLTEVLDQLGGKVSMVIEPKDGATAVASLVAEIVRRGLQNTVVVTIDANSDTSWVATCKAAGIATMLYWNGSSPGFTPSVATVMALQPTYMSIGYQYTDADISTVVAAAHAAGITVGSFSLNRRFERDRVLSLGVDWYQANDHIYVPSTGRFLTSDRFAMGVPTPGLVAGRNPGSGTIVPAPFTGSPTRLQLTNVGITGDFYSLGGFCPVASPAGTYTISASFTIDTTDTVTTRHLDVVVCAPDDAPFQADNKQNCYNCNLLIDGTMRIFRIDAGATADGVKAAGTSNQRTGNIASTALSQGQTIPVTVQVTPTTIVFTRTDTGISVTATDSTYRGAYFGVGKVASATGQLAASVSNVSVA